MAIHLSGLPGDIGRAGRPTLDLAPGGVYRAARVTPDAGALLPHRCTLACDGLGRPSAVCFLWHFPSSHLDWPLASTLPCGVPTFLDRVMPGRDHPTDSPSRTSVPDAGTAHGVSAGDTYPSRPAPDQLDRDVTWVAGLDTAGADRVRRPPARGPADTWRRTCASEDAALHDISSYSTRRSSGLSDSFSVRAP